MPKKTDPQEYNSFFMIGLSKRTDFSHLQVRYYLFDLQSTCTICSHNAGTVTSVSAMFHVQGRFFQDAVNRWDCPSVSDSLDVQFACFSRLDTFFLDEWSADVRMGWGVTNLQWILPWLYETLIFIQINIFGHGIFCIFWKELSLPSVRKYC